MKIQEDNNILVLTDLDSTNGTRVNGQDCQLRILRYGDIIAIGRSVLLFGTREEIASRLQEQSSNESIPFHELEGGDRDPDFDLSTGLGSSFIRLNSATRQPGIPERLSPAQLAQLAELLDYIHIRMGNVVESATIDEKSEVVSIDGQTWQVLLNAYGRIAELIRSLGDPDSTTPG